MTTYIKGTFSKSIYESNSGYIIGIFKVSDTNDEKITDYVGRSITFTGYFHELNNLDKYIFYGKLVNHDKYGEQFQVDNYERVKPEDKDSIVEFLTSGLFPGIGEVKAKKIVDVLGKDTLKIILDTPDNLILIPGITKKNIDVLHSKLKEYEASYEIILELNELGFSTRDAMSIYGFYKAKTKSVINDNLYQLIDDINDMSFKKIDAIALKNGVSESDINRICAAIVYIMNEVSNTYGHSYFFLDEIKFYLPRVLGISVDDKLMSKVFNKLEKDLKIIIKNERYYLKDMYEAELLIVKRFRMLNSNKEIKYKNLDDKLNELEENLNIKYNECQRNAIIKSCIRDFLIITGGPGTGKTTIMKGVCELYRILNKLSYSELIEKMVLLAPTGRAAKRMSEATLMPASTIHRFLKWQKETNKFQINEYNKSRAEIVIIDESSMIDTYLMASLLRGLSSRCKIIIVGDDNQLPSVGAGQVLHDIISSDMLEVVRLNELYRQADNSNIITLAYDIKNSYINRDIFNVDDDLTFIDCNDRDVQNNILEICNTYKDLNYRNFQILVPMYKGLNGIDVINDKVKNIFNPKDKNLKENRIGEVVFRENDKVIQLTNMPDDNVYNGDIGLIDRIVVSPKKEIYIDFDNNIVKYTPANFNNFRLAYAISIHKAQGSEFDVVIVPIVKGYNKMLYQKLIYTAVTRAKKKLYLIGDFKALEMAASNRREDERRTTIKEYLINGID